MNRFVSPGGNGVFTVFLIGPMNAATPPRSSLLDRVLPWRTVETGTHLGNIEEAARMALTALGLSRDRFQIRNPARLQGSAIVEDVFAEIDKADFAVADISSRSPNVFYELAFFNALGTPVVILDYDDRTIPFYWSQYRLTTLKRYSVEEIEPVMRSIFTTYFDPDESTRLSSNPISHYYRAPLIDASAAAGIAAGFFENFLVPVLQEGQGVLALPENEVRHLLLIRPERINDHDTDQHLVRAAMAGSDFKTLKAPLQRRNLVTARVKDGVIIDFPTPLYSMVQAPRYRRLRSALREAHNLSDEMRQAAFARMEEKFIASYFRTVEFLLDDTRNLARQRVSVVPIADFAARGFQVLN